MDRWPACPGEELAESCLGPQLMRALGDSYPRETHVVLKRGEPYEDPVAGERAGGGRNTSVSYTRTDSAYTIDGAHRT